MSQFDFDQQINRRDVPALKTHRIVLGEDGAALFPGGVADMDFRVAPPIIDALKHRLEHEIFGYEAVPDELLTAVQHWQLNRHGWAFSTDSILRAPNALNALAIATSLFSAPADGVIVQPPVFFDFFDVIRENGRQVVHNPLVLREGRYEMDYEGLERLARDPKNKLLFLCNPHNPIGRVWTKQELQRLSEICLRHGIMIVSDELHGDIIYPGHKHIPYASLSEEAASGSVTILSPAKSFNIASCCSAFTVIPNPEHRQAFQRENSRLTVNKNNAFANAAMLAAYQEGAPWLDATNLYLQGNLEVVRSAVAQLDGVQLIEPDATFLVWLDFRELKMAPDELHDFLRQKAHWAVTRGVSFGSEGAGFMRLNIACPRDLLTSALADLTAALNHLR